MRRVVTLLFLLAGFTFSATAQTSFGTITTGTNTSANMTVGSGAAVSTTGTGTIDATSVNGVTVSGTPTSGQVLTSTGPSSATWSGAPSTAPAGSNLQIQINNLGAFGSTQWMTDSTFQDLLGVRKLTAQHNNGLIFSDSFAPSGWPWYSSYAGLPNALKATSQNAWVLWSADQSGPPYNSGIPPAVTMWWYPTNLNLPSSFSAGRIDASTGLPDGASGYYSSDYLPVASGIGGFFQSNVMLQGDSGHGTCFYDNSRVLLSCLRAPWAASPAAPGFGWGTPFAIPIPAGAYYARGYIQSSSAPTPSTWNITQVDREQLYTENIGILDQRFGQEVKYFYNANSYRGQYGLGNQCQWDTLLNNNQSSSFVGPTCSWLNNSTNHPGYNFGNLDSNSYPGNQGWLGSTGSSVGNTWRTSGIHGGSKVECDSYGWGDVNCLDVHIFTKGGATGASDEGNTPGRLTTDEDPVFYGGVIAAFNPDPNNNNAPVVAVTSLSSNAWLGVGHAIIDTSHITTGAVTFASWDYTAPNSRTAIMNYTAGGLSVSSCAYIAAPVITGVPAGTPFAITNWAAAAAVGHQATFTFTFSGSGPSSGAYLLLGGFASSLIIDGMNGQVIKVASVSGSTFTAVLSYSGAAISSQSESGASATPWSPSAIANGGTAMMSMVLGPLQSGTGFNNTGVMLVEDLSGVDQAIPTQATLMGDGQTVITMRMQYEHPVGRMVCQGGLTGYRMNNTTYSGLYHYYNQYVTGSPSSSTVRVFFIGGGIINAFAENGNVQLMPGADVVSTLNPFIGSVDTQQFTIQDMPDAAIGDSIVQPNSIAAGWHGLNLTMGGFNPYAQYEGIIMSFPGATTTGGNNRFLNLGFVDQQTNVSYGYPGLTTEKDPNTGLPGVLTPPTIIGITGVVADAIYVDSQPDGALLHVGAGRCPSSGGYDSNFVGGPYTVFEDDSDAATFLTFYPCGQTVIENGVTYTDVLKLWNTEGGDRTLDIWGAVVSRSVVASGNVSAGGNVTATGNVTASNVTASNVTASNVTATNFSVSQANCLAATTISVPCQIYSHDFSGFNGTGTTGTVVLYTSNAPANTTLQICPNITIRTSDTAGVIVVTANYNGLHGASVFYEPFVNAALMQPTVPFNYAGSGVGCYAFTVAAGGSFLFDAAAFGGTSASVWDMFPIVTRLN